MKNLITAISLCVSVSAFAQGPTYRGVFVGTGPGTNAIFEVQGGGALVFSNSANKAKTFITPSGDFVIGNTSVYDTNVFYLEERLPVATNVETIAAITSVGGKYTQTNDGTYWSPSLTQMTFQAYKTNSSGGADVWVINDIGEGAGVLFFLTNNGAPSTFPIGPWFPNVSGFNANLGTSSTNVLIGSWQTTATAPMAQEARHSYSVSQYGRSQIFSGSSPMAMVALFPATGIIMTNTVAFITNNNLNCMIDVVEIDRWTISRSLAGNQIFNPATYGNLTISTYAAFMHANGLKAAIHEDFGVADYTGTEAVGGSIGEMASYPYYRQDATNIASGGIDYVMIDTTLEPSLGQSTKRDRVLEFLRELKLAQIQYLHPVFVQGALNGGFPNAFEDWMVAFDGFYTGEDVGQDATYLQVLKQSTGYRGFGRFPLLVNPDDAAFTSSAAAARRLGTFAVIGPAHMQFLNTNNLTSSTVGVFTNDEFRAIWRDVAGSPGWQISSNATGEVWARQMANGDTVIGFINLTAGAGSLSVSWSDLKIAPTNSQILCRDIFERTNGVLASSLTKALVAHEGSVFRLTPVVSGKTLTGNGSPEGAVAAPIGWIYLRLDSTGNTYTKTNGTGSTGWYDNLLRTHG